MPEASGDLVVQTRSHQRFGWILIPLEVGGDVILDVVLSTYSPVSSLNDNMCRALVNLDFADDLGSNTCLLRALRIQGQPIPDFPVRRRRALPESVAQGILGLDFLNQFSEIHFNVASRQLTLTDP